ncbi:MAG: hypothetical protein PHY47_01625 [Lachnospiraceae bacterium]|nr:hypothetical protein [Lachnospiraceae bacterium]
MDKLALQSDIFDLAKGYYIRQVVVIIGIFFLGYVFLSFMQRRNSNVWKALLAYPIGLSIWGLVSYCLLEVGIPYRLSSIGISILLLLIVLCIYFVKQRVQIEFSWKRFCFLFFLVAVISLISASGILRVSISNDSVYYYSVFPEILVKTGYYLASFDVFLTDVGQTTAIINCIPYFFGFNESFGIQHFLNFNFAGIFYMAVYETIQNGRDKKKASIFAVFSTMLLFSSTPFLLTSKWVLANVYFMDFLFIIFYLGIKREREKGNEEGSQDLLWIQGILIAMLCMMRMEGGMMACLLILCISYLSYSNKELICYLTLPVCVMQLSYYAMLFIRLKVDPLYSFLDIKKAMVMVLLLAMVFIYFLLFRNKVFLFLQKYFATFFIGTLSIGNLLLLILNTDRYMTNLSCFGQNIILQNGWGYFGFFVLIMLLLLPKSDKKMSYSDLFCIGYILFTIAVCWARSGTLRIGIGDSGNRVMMQIIPFVVFTIVEKITELIYKK